MFGKCKISCDVAASSSLAEILCGNDITTDPIRIVGNRAEVTLWESRKKRFENAAKNTGFQYEISRMPGIPGLLGRYRYRPGILVGTVIFFALIWYSGRVIWDFDVTGNQTVPDSEIISALAEVGCDFGSYIPSIDFSQIQNDCLIDNTTLAWVSVNMDGNLAHVEVRERRAVDMKFVPEKGRFANIIAAEDGVIELCSVRRGEAAVMIGDTVKKGELLITGVIDVGEDGVRYEYADGEVKARVLRQIVKRVDFKGTETVTTGARKVEKTVNFFGFSANLFSKGGIGYDLYGIIKNEERLSLPFGITLPFRVSTTEYTELCLTQRIFTEEEALAVARRQAQAELASMAETLQVLSVDESEIWDETGVTLTLSVYGVTDIGANYGFAIDGSTDTKNNH